jgi:hypothetical protein
VGQDDRSDGGIAAVVAPAFASSAPSCFLLLAVRLPDRWFFTKGGDVMSQSRNRLIAAVLLGSALVIVPVAAWAHEEVESGNYVLEIGWVNEPVIVGEQNGLDLFVAPKDDPEAGIADLTTLQFTVEYGSANQNYGLVPDDEAPGHYTAAFIPTREGQYTFHLTGTIQEEAVDVSVEPEEVVAAGEMEFPEPAASSGASTQTLAIAGVALGLFGVGLGAYSLLRKK